MRRTLPSLLAVIVIIAAAHPVLAQATRTWVSGVGDDANPCSRTAPCKTFGGTISKTAAGGEINVLDPGGFGPVTITKSITISAEGVEAGVLVSGTNAIIINTTNPNDVVVLRGLDIEGLGTGLDGVKLLSPLALHIENCTINAFRGTNGNGIEIATSTGTAELFVKNSIVRNNLGGILVKPTGAANVNVSIENTLVDNNSFGVKSNGASTTGTIRVSVKGGSANGNAGGSLIAIDGGVTRDLMMIDGTDISNNGFGPRADNALVRYGNCIVTGNTTGLSTANAGQLISYGTNQVHGNVADGSPTTTISTN